MYCLKGQWDGNVLTVDTIYNMGVQENAYLDTSDGVIVEDMPVFPEKPIGKGAILKADTDGETWFEEVDVPLTPEQEMQLKLQQQQALIDMLILDSLGGAE